VSGPSRPAPLTDGFGEYEPLGVGDQPLYRADADRILRVLAANQFDDPNLAFRELYANALDAVRARPDASIELRVAADKVVVEDAGSGLDAAGLEALTTLGASTRRGHDAIGRFGIGFASVFDPALGVRRLEFVASFRGPDRAVDRGVDRAVERAAPASVVDRAAADRIAAAGAVRVAFTPDVSGGVAITVEPAVAPRLCGSRVEVHFDAARAPKDRVAKITEVFETHAAYSGVATSLNGRALGRDLTDYVKAELRAGEWSPVERALITHTAVKGPVGVAAIDPTRSDSKFRAYQRGLFVCELPLARLQGRPWPRGVFGAVHADGLDLVASRNAFVENEPFERFQDELRRLAQEAAYRVVRYYEQTEDAYARVVLLDALRRGLKTTTCEGLLAESSDLFSSAVVRSPLFHAWGSDRRYSFEELVVMKRNGAFRALSYRPAGWDLEAGPVMRADDSVERDVFRKLSGMRDMPAAARAEQVSKPTIVSRLLDRVLSGPRAEYSLFQRQVERARVPVELRAIVDALEAFMATDEVSSAVARLIPGALPRLGFGVSRNAFGPVAAYRLGEIRFNVRHRLLKKLARTRSPDLAARALLPVLAHELAHVCHELHDLDFYRTSRALLRTLVAAAARLDAQAALDGPALGPAGPSLGDPSGAAAIGAAPLGPGPGPTGPTQPVGAPRPRRPRAGTVLDAAGPREDPDA
jgi:hypothetical protein